MLSCFDCPTMFVFCLFCFVLFFVYRKRSSCSNGRSKNSFFPSNSYYFHVNKTPTYIWAAKHSCFFLSLEMIFASNMKRLASHFFPSSYGSRLVVKFTEREQNKRIYWFFLCSWILSLATLFVWRHCLISNYRGLLSQCKMGL